MATEAVDSRRTPSPVTVFISYAHEDEALKRQLSNHLSILKRHGVISEWHDRLISPGADWSNAIDSHLESAQIILLLVSSDFLASDYCYETEMKRAIEKHERGEARVVPIFLRPCTWKGASFENLQGLPLDAKPVTEWSSRDKVFENVAQGIRIIAEVFQFSGKRSSKVEIKVIEDPEDDDLMRALFGLYEKRIPVTERFDTSDIVRWIREDKRGTPDQEALGSRNHFVVAKMENEVWGFVLAHSYARLGWVFLAYMVAEKGLSIDKSFVSQKLIDFIFELFKTGDRMKEYPGFMLEVDDPVLADTEKERTERLARIRLFCTLAERRHLQLRALDFDYRQPNLTIPEGTELSGGLPMLLMYAARSRSQQGWVGKEEVSILLDFICNQLYPEGFSEVPEDNERYRAYTSDLCRAQIAALPEQVPALSSAQIQARRTRLKAKLTFCTVLNGN